MAGKPATAEKEAPAKSFDWRDPAFQERLGDMLDDMLEEEIQEGEDECPAETPKASST